MESVKCPKCGTVTFKEKKKCPRCNYDFSKIKAEPQPIAPRVVFVVREGVPQAARKITVTVSEIFGDVFESVTSALKRAWGFVVRSFTLVALFFSRAAEALVNVLFAPILYLIETTGKGVGSVVTASLKAFAATLVGAAKFKTAVQSIPELFKRRKERTPKVGRAVEVRPVTMVPFARTPMQSAAVEAVPPLVRPFPAVLVKEAVSLEGVEVMPAGIFSRFLAGVIDISIILLTVGTLLIPAWLAGSFSFLTLVPDKFAKVSLAIYLFVIAIAGIYLVVAISVYGKTFGKRLFGLRVVKVSGEPLNLYDSFIRFFAWLISGLFFGLGWLWLVFDLNHRSLHDYLSQTVVIRDAS